MSQAASHAASHARWALLPTLVALVLTLVLARHRLAPTAAAASTTAGDRFSALRAADLLTELVGDNMPHPIGSAANEKLHDRIVSHLRQLGYSPELQDAFTCNRRGVCATVRNIIVRIAGRPAGGTVLLACHYDSVAAGPGAADDGAAVVIGLEIARILADRAPLRNEVVLLFDDGEEAGLLGAQQFMESVPHGRIQAAINLEARGTSGPSLMFESGRDNAWSVRRIQALPHPVATSVFTTVYELLPNDSDFTVFKEHGLEGVNFAFIGGVNDYHTANDRASKVDRASLQSHGDNALAMVQAMASADLARIDHGRAVFFDLFAWRVVSWPEPWSPALAATSLLLLVMHVVRWRKRYRSIGRQVAQASATVLAVVVVAGVAGLALCKLLAATGALPREWVAHPGPAIAAVWLAALSVMLAGTLVLARRTAPEALWLGLWVSCAAAALALAIAAPGLSYLFIVPALAAGVMSLVGAWRPQMAAIPAFVHAALWFPLLLLLFDAIGAPALPFIAGAVGLGAATIAPLVVTLERRHHAWLCSLSAVATLACATVAMLVSPVSTQAPEELDIAHYDDGERATWVITGEAPLPPAIGRVASFAETNARFDWAALPRTFVAAAPRSDEPAPELHVLASTVSDGSRTVRALLRSPRRAPWLTLELPAGVSVRSARLGGQLVAPGTSQTRTTRSLTCLTTPREGIEVELTLGDTAPIDVVLTDASPGLPPAAAAIVHARPPTAVPFQDGDVTLRSRKIRL